MSPGKRYIAVLVLLTLATLATSSCKTCKCPAYSGNRTKPSLCDSNNIIVQTEKERCINLPA